jgi:hypothetical protein
MLFSCVVFFKSIKHPPLALKYPDFSAGWQIPQARPQKPALPCEGANSCPFTGNGVHVTTWNMECQGGMGRKPMTAGRRAVKRRYCFVIRYVNNLLT